MSLNRLTLITIFFLIGSITYSQKVSDSINKLSFSDLLKGYYKNIAQIEVAEKYARTYLKKTLIDYDDPISIAEAYELFAYLYNDSTKIKYLDTIINSTINLKNKKYPARSYNQKGNFFYLNGAYENALQNYIIADRYASENFNEELLFTIKHNIGILKQELGEYQEALIIFKEVNDYYFKNNHPEYIKSLHSLSNSHIYNKNFEQASKINILGIQEAEKNNSDYHNFFTLNEGVNQFFKSNYKKAIDSIKKALPFLKKNNQKRFLINAYIFLGKSHKQLNDKSIASINFTKADSLFSATGIVTPESHEGYNFLKSYYKKTGNIKAQLFYIDRLLYLDSIIKNQHTYLIKNIAHAYETPKLLAEKNELIKHLENDKKKTKNFVFLLILLIGLLCFILSYYYYRQQLFKKRYNLLIQADQKQYENLSQEHHHKNENLGIATDVVDDILKNLEKFEQQKGYLQSSLSLNTLAKKIKTNPNYLSRVINFYKQKNFRTYLNDIRMNYIINELKQNSVMRRYSVKAIAKEAGFNNVESFSNIFYKKTGIYPSYFIKRINK